MLGMEKPKNWTVVDGLDEFGNLEFETAEYLVGWIKDAISKKKDKEYSEDLVIREDGHLDSDKRTDGTTPFLSMILNSVRREGTGISSRSVHIEDFYRLIKQLQDGYPELEFKVTSDDVNRGSITYSVKLREKPDS
jgi:hypothetical protein